MRVVSWNIQCIRGGRRRVDAIADALTRHAPDVVALQEVSVENGFPEALGGALHDRGLVGCQIGRPQSGARKRYANAIAATSTVYSPNVGSPTGDESRHWRHLVFSAQVTVTAGAEIVVFSVHMPNGSGNGWAKIDAFEALAAALHGRPGGVLIVAGDFNEPFRFEDGRVVSFAYEHGERPDALWRRRGTHTPEREYPRRKWQESVARVLDRDTDLCVRRILPKDGSYERVSHVTTDGRPRLFDHILVSEGIRSPGVAYDTSVLGGQGYARLSDHAIAVADLSIE